MLELNPVWSKYSNAQRVSSLHVYHNHERNHPGKENLLLFSASNLCLYARCESWPIG